jgi:hypothetical protein
LTILGTAATISKSVNIGVGSQVSSNDAGGGCVAIGKDTKATGFSGVAVGSGAKATGSYATAFGNAEATKTYSVAVGNKSYATEAGATAIGANTTASANHAIQIGYGTNSTANTFSVGLNNDNNSNYRILESDGTIPAARHASLPSTDGTYVLKLVISDGVPTLSWVAE